MAFDDSTHARLFAKLEQGAQQLGLQLQQHQIDLLVSYLALVHKWNRVYNLTAVRNVDDMVGRHILDSLSVLSWLPDNANPAGNTDASADVLDVGSGAGLPVLPLAIIRTDLHFLSVESNGKKTRFQQQAVLELGLSNVRIKQERIEEVSELAHCVISRAFTAPETFVQVVDKNCLQTTKVIIMLGQKDRLPELLPAGFTASQITEVDVPQCDAIRHIAVCTKVRDRDQMDSQ